MIIFLFANACRRYPPGIPILSSNTITISAACHPSKQEYDDVAVRPIKYGVLEVDADTEPKPTGFSARPVAPLRNGELYGGMPDTDDDENDDHASLVEHDADIRPPSPAVKAEAAQYASTGRSYDFEAVSLIEVASRPQSKLKRNVTDN